MEITDFLNAINRYILNPLIGLAFAVALLVFFWGIFQFIATETGDTKREEGKKKILWGLVGMFIMFSAYGLIYLILGMLGVDAPPYIQNR